MSTATSLPENRVVLRNVSWATFERLLAETDRRGSRFTYDRGTLEIMSPSREHERCKALLGRMIEAMTEVWLYDGHRLQVHLLQSGGRYMRQAHSASFPFLPPAEIERFLAQRDATDETTWVRRFRAWVKTLDANR